MRKLLLILLIAMPLLAGCSQTDVLEGDTSAAVSFDTHIGKTSRAVAVTDFVEGDTIGVYMYHAPTDWATNGIADSERKMNNVALRLDAGTWTYSPLLFWTKDEKYTFFAYAPYNKDAVVSNTGVLSYTVGVDETKQQDLLYSVPAASTKDKSWDGTATVPGKVQFVFAHALSQVKFSVATEYDYSSLYTIELTDIKLNNICTTGNLNLITKNTVVEPWSGQSAPGTITYSLDALTLSTSLQSVTNATGDVWMLLPQTLPENTEVEFTLHLTKTGDIGTAENDKDYTLKATLTAGTWEHNKVYNYQVTLNMDQILGVKPIVIGAPQIVPWEEEEGQELDPVITTVEVSLPDGEAGSASNEFNLVKHSASTQSSQVSLQTLETWTADVEDDAPVTATTRADGSGWLQLADDASGLNASGSKTGTGDSSFYIYIPSRNTLPEARSASVIVSSVQNPKLKIRINVTQEGAAVSAMTVAGATGTMDTGFSVLKESSSGQGSQVSLTGNGAWQASSSADWLQLSTTASGSGASMIRTGTGSSTFYLYLASANTSQTADRTATITITGASATDVQGVITVTQSKAYPAITATVAEAESGSTATNYNVIMSYMASSTDIQINNNSSGLLWTASSNQSWLKVATSESGANAAISQTGTNSTTLYAYVSALSYNTPDRSGIITLSRAESEDIKINVTQGDFVYVNGVKWARGNLRQNGSGVSQDMPNYAGLFFKYGSLIGRKLVKDYSASAIGFKPSEYSSTPDTWAGIPYLVEIVSGNYSSATGTGDICKYLSDKGMIGASGTVWRIPSLAESEKLVAMPTLSYGDFVNSTNYQDIVPSGTFIGQNASTATDPANPPKGTVFIPAVGVFWPSGEYGGYNSLSACCVSPKNYMGNSSVTKKWTISPNKNDEGWGYSVRCIRSN